MIQKGKACPAVGAAEQASVGSILADGDSHNHCTHESTASQWKISDFLSTGRENALPLRYLVAVSGRDGRTVRQMIEKERRSGTPILSDCQSGYFLAADSAETQIFVRSMRHRAGEILKTAMAIERGTELD